MKNKTPIQELISEYNLFEKSIYESESISEARYFALELREKIKSEYLQKEKQFAFDCFEAGYSEAWEDDSRTLEEDFDLFYASYVEQHTK